jgi:hypothetical protein
VMSRRRVRMAPAMCVSSGVCDTGGGVCDTGSGVCDTGGVCRRHVCVAGVCVSPVVCMLCVCRQWCVCRMYVVSVVVVGPDLHMAL